MSAVPSCSPLLTQATSLTTSVCPATVITALPSADQILAVLSYDPVRILSENKGEITALHRTTVLQSVTLMKKIISTQVSCVQTSYHSASASTELIQSSCIIHSSGSGAVIRSTYSISTTSSWTQTQTPVHEYKNTNEMAWNTFLLLKHSIWAPVWGVRLVIPLIFPLSPCERTAAFAGIDLWPGSRTPLCCETLWKEEIWMTLNSRYHKYFSSSSGEITASIYMVIVLKLKFHVKYAHVLKFKITWLVMETQTGNCVQVTRVFTISSL